MNVPYVSHYVVSDSFATPWTSPPGSSVHKISQARILKWVAFPSPRDLPNPRIEPTSPSLAGGFLPLSHHVITTQLVNMISN